MKKSIILIVPILLSLSGCSRFHGDVATKEINVYSLNKYEGPNKIHLDDLFIKTVNVSFEEDEKLIPYLTLKEYASTYDYLINNEKYVSSITENSYLSRWTIGNDDGLIFYAEMTSYGTTTIGGSISAAFKDDGEGSSNLLMYQLKAEATDLVKGYNLATYRNTNAGFNILSNKVVRYPLGLLDIVFSKYSDLHLYYSYKSLYQLSNATQLNNVPINFKYCIFDETRSTVSHYHDEMPYYLRRYNQSALIYIFDNFYGLGHTRGVDICTEIYNSLDYDKLTSPRGDVRTEGLANIIANLNDGHTSLEDNYSIPWKETVINKDGKLWAERKTLYYSLQNKRNAVYRQAIYEEASDEEKEEMDNNPKYKIDTKKILYSEDGSLATFGFDNFQFDTRGSTPDEYSWWKDSYLYMVHQFEAILNSDHDVKNVVIDMSLNTGGTIGVLFKILALLSKDNQPHVTFYDNNRDNITKYTVSVDSNNDEVYDENDVYGNKFEHIYLLTSPLSFSCGNALPFLASRQKLVKLMGVNSGGGECAVGYAFLPNGQGFYYSSNTHIGDYEEEKVDDNTYYSFVGDEDGANVYAGILDYDMFYDLDCYKQAMNSIASYDAAPANN